MNIIEFFDQNWQLQKWQQGFSKRERTLLTGLSGTAKSLVMANAYENVAEKYIIVTDSQFHANELYDELSTLLGEEKVFQFFSDDNIYAEFALASKDRVAYRLEALNFLLDEKSTGFLVVPFLALRSYLPSPENFLENYLLLTSGDEYDLSNLVNLLSNAGYEKTQRVMTPGEFSMRGDIVDIYPLDAENPVRLEFFGDEVDTIRSFDVESQRSLTSLERLEIYPASDFILTDNEFDKGAKSLTEMTNLLTDPSAKSYMEEVISAAQNHYYHKDLRKFAEYFYDKKTSLLNYFPKNVQIFIDDFQKVNEINNKLEMELADFILSEKAMERGFEGQTYLLDTMVKVRNYKPATFFSNFQKGLGNLRFEQLYNFKQHSMQQFFGQLELFYTEVERFIKQEFTVVLAVSSEKLRKSLHELDLSLQEVDRESIQVGKVNLIDLQLSNGFNFLDEKLVVMTEHEIFGKMRKKKARKLNITNAERLKDYNELAVGDFVVHKNHGIGKYLGLQTLEVGGMHRDYLTIQYQNGDTISVPVDHLDLLSKYTAGEGKSPKINKLNDGRWRKTMSSVSKQVEDISDDLIKLYAERQAKKGFAFSPDDASQEEFDSGFSYVETEDQIRSINEIKHDMELERPMDRLLVGDVGFGKTEVAMRAAFKAINDGKQVAVLVPTTVLAEQHFNNFTERFINFGVNVEVLSRFQTKTQQTEILAKLKKGRVDLIIGTHRLLSKDVEFFDLGLMIIDEEQRFGVKHKEKLEELKARVDVLTLTATPIPRTLHMSMLGIRDLSIIETAPTNRYPVQTYVMETNPGLIREAILREMDRGGQIFYVYNRVETIDQKVSELHELVPEARIGFVHGQMSEVMLENTLLDFLNGDYDVLVATTIIETGIDISNVNTLFIENADHMGLSTLYQLRGRVGRSNRIAYAYLMYRPDKVLTEVSEKRLDAIKGFTELGSGFKIAMRDLSIRGAGNILGASQSGFIDSVGFEMYSQLLEEAINKRQGKTQVRRKGNAEFNLQIDAYLPSDYISDERQKIEIYKRIREIENQKDYQDLQDELIDRFGEYPDQVAYLIEIGLVKAYLDAAFAELVERKNDTIIVRFEKASLKFFLTQDYFEAISKTHLKAKISDNQGKVEITFDVRNKKDYEILEELKIFGQTFMEIKERKEKKEA